MSQVSISIDGRKVEVPAGTTIYKAAKELDIDIPVLCYMDLKDLNIENKPGGCRICSVEVEGRRNLAPSCSTDVSDGMNVKTNSRLFELPVSSARGCPWKCNFCFKVYSGLRQREPTSVVDEIIATPSFFIR